MEAGLAALTGRRSEALEGYRAVRVAWRDLGLAWDEALAGIDMAMVFSASQSEVADAAARSREILTRLRARPFLVLLDAALERGGVAGMAATQ